MDKAGRLRNLNAWVMPSLEDRRRYDTNQDGQMDAEESLALESELRQRFVKLIETLLAEPEPKQNP